MNRIAPFAVLALAGCTGEAPPAVPDTERVQGVWNVVRMERGGVPVPSAETAGAAVIFKTGCVVVRDAGGKLALFERFTLEPHHDPPRITVHEDPPPWAAKDPANGVAGANGGPIWNERKVVGIYRFADDGRLILCFVRGSDSPPWGFGAKSHPDGVLFVLAKARD
jgi:uncharacterized protein (TIGR03067 family)